MVEIASWVQAGVKLGVHLCYGDTNHAHIKDPEDTALMVRVMKHIATHVARPVDWFHLPVPIDRDPTGYYETLPGLAAGDDTTIHLRIVNARDGENDAHPHAKRATTPIKEVDFTPK